MAISTAGLGSGIDFNSLVSQLVAAESEPQTALFDQKETILQARLSAFGVVKSALTTFQAEVVKLQSADAFSNRKATSASTSTFTATATNSAVLGSYDIQVTQLAENHKLRSTDFTDSSTVIGTGTLTISVGGSSFGLTIDDSNKTVAGIRDAINNASSNTGVTATTITVDTGTQLVLTSNDTGSNNNIVVTAINGGEGDLQQLVYDPLPAGSGTENLVQINPAQDSIIQIDSQNVTNNTNTVAGAIDGVTLTLNAADPGNDHTLDIVLDTGSISAKIQSFVDAYNEYTKSINESMLQSETQQGILLGDALTRSIERQIRTKTTQQVSGIYTDYNSLAAIGITTQKDGSLKIDSTTLNNVIDTDLTSLTNLFTAENGIANIVDSTIDSYVEFNGILDTKTDGIKDSISDITKQREQLAFRMESLEARLTAQFIAMDGLVSQLTSTGTFLTDALKNIPKPNSIGKN